MLFDRNDLAGQTACQRASKHLICTHTTQVLDIGDDPATPAANWFLSIFSG